MKKMKNITLIVALFLTTTVFGQKLGHINSNELLMAMPERTTIENEIKKYAQQLESQLGTMTQEYQAKVQNYQSKEATMTEAIKQDKIKEITNLEERISEFQQT